MKEFEIITKEVKEMELVEKKEKGEAVLDENQVPVMEEKEVVKEKEFVREYIDTPKEEKIAILEQQIANTQEEITLFTVRLNKLQGELSNLQT